MTVADIDPMTWGVYVGVEGFLCGGCNAVLVEPRRHDGARGIPTALNLMLDAVTEHLPTCRRAIDLTPTRSAFRALRRGRCPRG